MRLRRSPAAIASIAALALLGACSSGGGGENEPTTQPPATNGEEPSEEPSLSGDVTLWVYPVIADEVAHNAHWDKQIAGFNELHPDVNVNVEIYPWANRDEAITTAIISNTTPDAIYLIPDQLAAYADALEDVRPYLSDEHLADLHDNVIESVTIDGRMMGAPILTTSMPLICNAGIFDQIGETTYPETWDDLKALAPRLKDEGFYTLAYAGGLEETLNLTFYPLLWQAGGQVFTDDGSGVAFNSDAGREALAFISEFAAEGWVERDPLVSNVAMEQTALANNQVACTYHHDNSMLEPFWGAENVHVVGPLQNKEAVTYGTVGSLAMFQSSNNKEATAAFLEYATSGDGVVEYLKTSNFFPAISSVGAIYADHPVLGEVEKTIPFATVGDLHPNAREVMGVLSPELQAALLGSKSVEDALSSAAREAEYIVD